MPSSGSARAVASSEYPVDTPTSMAFRAPSISSRSPNSCTSSGDAAMAALQGGSAHGGKTSNTYCARSAQRHASARMEGAAGETEDGVTHMGWEAVARRSSRRQSGSRGNTVDSRMY